MVYEVMGFYISIAFYMCQKKVRMFFNGLVPFTMKYKQLVL